jgi:hypothetical protein
MQANPNASSLNARNDRDRIHPVGTVADLCLIVVASIVFNAFPDKVGFIRSFTDPSSFTPLLAPEFQMHLPLLNLYWGLAFSLGIANLVMLRWNIVTRYVEIALSILGVFVLIELVLGGPLTVYGWLDLCVKFGLAVAIIPAIIDAIRKVEQLLSGWQITVQSK